MARKRAAGTELRFNGPDQQDDAFYLASSMHEADRVISKLGCEPSSVIVDIGCGQGRLPIGLVLRLAQRGRGVPVGRGFPPFSINPENYTRFACHGPLHIVRYDRRYFWIRSRSADWR